MRRELPYLAPWYRVAAGGDQVVLEYGQRVVCLTGKAAGTLVPALLPLLDGTRTVDEIVRILGEPARPAVELALDQLDEHGVLLEGPPLPDDLPPGESETIALLTGLKGGGGRLADTAEPLAGSSVGVVGDGAQAAEICRLLRRSGVAVTAMSSLEGGVDLTVCAPPAAELPRLRDWNRQALGTNHPWLQVLPFDGRYAAVGPLYLPGDTCCYECFRLRRSANLDAGHELPLLEGTPAAYPSTPALAALVASLATLLVLEWLVLGNQYVPAAFYALELVPEVALGLHYVHRVPRCPACSGLAEVAPPLPWHKEIPVVGG